LRANKNADQSVMFERKTIHCARFAKHCKPQAPSNVHDVLGDDALDSSLRFDEAGIKGALIDKRRPTSTRTDCAGAISTQGRYSR